MKTRRSRGSGCSDEEELRAVKRERLAAADEHVESEVGDESTLDTQTHRRGIRSKYLKIMNKIQEHRDDLTSADSNKFTVIFGEVERLHKQVTKPREQVADAEALLDIANTLAISVKSYSNEGITPADFVNSLLTEFDPSKRGIAAQENAQISIRWKDIGLAAATIFRKGHGCCTMVGPMNTELKPRKIVVHRKRANPTESSRPEELDYTEAEEKTDTDKNMSTMFNILKDLKTETPVRLESLILNRISFAQTVENLFALSFLVKDGRAEIKVDANGSHRVVPQNYPKKDDSTTPAAVPFRHFVFRLDFKDWKLMLNVVPVGEEMMPHRETSNLSAASQAEPAGYNTNAALRTTPIRKLSRNRGLVVQAESFVDCNHETEARRSKRKLL